MKFNENDTADIEMELKLPADDLKTMQAPSNVNCDLFFPKDDKDGPEFVVEDRSADGNMHCVGSAKGQPLNKTSAGGETAITNEDGIYTLKSEALPVNLTQGLDELGISTNANIVFEFPGEVLESNVGTVDGNKVTVTDLNQLKQPMTIKAKSTPGGGDILMWVLVGVGILLLLGLVLWLLLRKKGPRTGRRRPVLATGRKPARTMAANHTPVSSTAVNRSTTSRHSRVSRPKASPHRVRRIPISAS